MKITRVTGRECFDGRGLPTLLAEIELSDGTIVTGYAPADARLRTYQAHEKRDGLARFGGQGVLKAISVINEIVSPFLLGKEPMQPELDFALIQLDGTPDKSNLGANVLIALSMALFKAHAYIEQIEVYELCSFLVGSDSVTLPCPQITLISAPTNEAAHARIEKYMIAPVGASTLREAIEACFTLYHDVGRALISQGKLVGTSLDGGLITSFDDDRYTLDLLIDIIERAVQEGSTSFALAIDASANAFYEPQYDRYKAQHQAWTAQELVNFYNELVQTYPVYSIEDGMAEDDWEGWRLLTETLGDKIQIVGGDIFATSPERMSYVADYNIATAVSIKPAQVGTITEAIQVINLCKKYQLNPIIALSDGETEDPFIADLVVGTSAGQIKAGGCSRSERVAKYNRLLAIEDVLIASRNRF